MTRSEKIRAVLGSMLATFAGFFSEPLPPEVQTEQEIMSAEMPGAVDLIKDIIAEQKEEGLE